MERWKHFCIRRQDGAWKASRSLEESHYRSKPARLRAVRLFRTPTLSEVWENAEKEEESKFFSCESIGGPRVGHTRSETILVAGLKSSGRISKAGRGQFTFRSEVTSMAAAAVWASTSIRSINPITSS